LTGGQARTDVDFGYRLPTAATASISSSLWNDLDGDGERDEGEPFIAGVTITLSDEDGNVLATTTTDANGDYRFPGLQPGTYVVTVEPPLGYTPTTVESYTITLRPGEAVTNVTNFGLQPQAPPPPPPPTDIPTLSEVAMLALLALLVLAGWRNIDQTGRRRTRG
jgi:MYXO-CTERM domain-containing protein